MLLRWTLLLLLIPSMAHAKDLCDLFKWMTCPGEVSSSYGRTSSSANPSSGSAGASNPGSLNIARGFGIESIFYDKADIGLTTGNGRIGGAISSQNSEETFFGNISQESTAEYKGRVEARSSYRAHKYALALAMKLAGEKGSSSSKKLPKWMLNFGLLGKYNEATDNISPGLGLGLTLGPLNFGVSQFYDDYVDSISNTEKSYRVGFYSAGLRFGPIVLDYSYTETFARTRSQVKLLTGSVYISKFIFSSGRRWEDSDRPHYVWAYKYWSGDSERTDNFYGAQYKVGRVFLAGLFYNFYLVHDLSLGATFLF